MVPICCPFKQVQKKFLSVTYQIKPRAKPSVSTLEFCLTILTLPAPDCQVHFRISKAFCLLLANMKLHLADAMIIMKIMMTKKVVFIRFSFPKPFLWPPYLSLILMCRDLCGVSIPIHALCPSSLQDQFSYTLPFFHGLSLFRFFSDFLLYGTVA